MGSKVKKIMKKQLKFWTQFIEFEMIYFSLLFFSGNVHFYNVVFTLINVEKLEVDTNYVV